MALATTVSRFLADDGNFYILRHQQAEDNWVLDSFRRGAPRLQAAVQFDVAAAIPLRAGSRIGGVKPPLHQTVPLPDFRPS